MGETKDGGRGLLGTAATVAIVVLVAVVVVLGVVYFRAPRLTRVRVGQTPPDFTVGQLDPSVLTGTTATLSRMRRPLVLFFLDTRWPGATAYARSAELLYRRTFRRGLEMMAVMLDDDLAHAREFRQGNELTFTVVSDPHAGVVGKSYGVPRAPEAYLIDKQGRVSADFTDRLDWADLQTRDAIEKHLEPGAW